MSAAGEAAKDAMRSGLAVGAVTEVLIMLGRSASDADKRNTALAVAMGVLHGCCGPNGDFTAEYRPPLSPLAADAPGGQT